ncbi:phage holin family protein [Sphingomonas soli]|uniref:phage holin family protein n=1 Tax=Sphingomonas soli TaxID=266127 RepID=UPI00082AA327|nr:phage holin family protein [Sphingomonas soli]
MSEPQPEEGIGDLLSRLAEDGKGYAQAEIDYYRTLARAKLRDARAMLWMGAAAMALALAASVALVVGLVLTLAPRVGPGWATLIVVTGISLVSAVMARLAWVQVKRILGEKP